MKTQGQKAETHKFKTKTYLSQTFKKPDHPLKCRSWEGPEKGLKAFCVSCYYLLPWESLRSSCELNLPPSPLTLARAWRCRDSWRYFFLSLGIRPSASSLARACRRFRIRWYCLALTYRGSSSRISAAPEIQFFDRHQIHRLKGVNF